MLPWSQDHHHHTHNLTLPTAAAIQPNIFKRLSVFVDLEVARVKSTGRLNRDGIESTMKRYDPQTLRLEPLERACVDFAPFDGQREKKCAEVKTLICWCDGNYRMGNGMELVTRKRKEKKE